MEKPVDLLRPVAFKEHDWPLKAVRKSKKEVFPRGFPIPEVTAKPDADQMNSNIAAIDFGTTHCSLAYTTEAGGTVSLQLNEIFTRVPTAILLKKKDEVFINHQSRTGCSAGVYVHVHAFGKNAQSQYQRIRGSDRSNYIYFERMKMHLQHDQVSLVTVCISHSATPSGASRAGYISVLRPNIFIFVDSPITMIV